MRAPTHVHGHGHTGSTYNSMPHNSAAQPAPHAAHAAHAAHGPGDEFKVEGGLRNQGRVRAVDVGLQQINHTYNGV